MISHELKFVFIHNPKTGGNSLSLFLKDFLANDVIQRKSPMGEGQGISIMCEINKGHQIKHQRIDYYEALYGDRIKDYFKFAIIRNPYDRLLSSYFFRKGQHDQIFNRQEFINYVKETDWSEYFQHRFIRKDFHLIGFENLINELKQVKIFKYSCNFNEYPRLNSSANFKMDYRKVYDRELKDLAYDKFKEDFQILGYPY